MFERCKQWIGRWFSTSDRFSLEQDSLGRAGEKAAATYLQKLGYRILAHGHRQRLGEIDLIALDGKWIVFVEVKTWASNQGGDPSLAVDASKQEKLTRAALIYLKRRRLLEQPARFDVVSIVWPKSTNTMKSEPTIRHFKNAFDAVGSGQMYR
jgi:putative endonuclease